MFQLLSTLLIVLAILQLVIVPMAIACRIAASDQP